MRCPKCNHGYTKVIEARTPNVKPETRRRRECPKCEERFSTCELYAKEGSRERYKSDQEEMMESLMDDAREVSSILNHILNTGNYCPVCGRWKPDEHTEACAATKAVLILAKIGG